MFSLGGGGRKGEKTFLDTLTGLWKLVLQLLTVLRQAAERRPDIWSTEIQNQIPTLFTDKLNSSFSLNSHQVPL